MKYQLPMIIALLTSISFLGMTFADENKNVTVISGTSTADGKSTVHKEILEECLVSLPKIHEIKPQVSSQSEFLKGIGGDANKNEFMVTYTANIEINYIVFQKVLIIITTNSIQGKEPVTKIVEKKLRQSIRFDSDPSQGDIFAGRSKRKHYYSTADGATKDALKRAEIWLQQQRAVVCP